MIMRRVRAVIATIVCILCCVVSASAQGKLTAGVGKSDITPAVGTPLAGYGARLGKPSTGVPDPTEARALVIANGAEKIALLSVDPLGFDLAMHERTRD